MHFTHEPAVRALYLIQSFNSKRAYLAVEFFFIIAGFFLFCTYKNKEQSWIRFVLRKFIRLWPALVCFSVASTVLHFFHLYWFNSGLDSHLLNMMFLQGMGLAPKHCDFNWFISVYFWVIIFYFYILKNFQSKYANLIIALCIYFSLVGNLNCSNFTLSTIDTYKIFFNAGLLRGLSGIGIGYFTGMFYYKVKNHIDNNKSTGKKGLSSFKIFILASIAEFGCFYFLIKNLLFKNTEKNALIFIAVFLLLFLMFLFKKGAISKAFENKYLAFFGKYSYSIYVMQAITFCILQHTLWKVPYFITHIYSLIFITLFAAVLFGIITYHAAEKHLMNWLKRQFSV